MLLFFLRISLILPEFPKTTTGFCNPAGLLQDGAHRNWLKSPPGLRSFGHQLPDLCASEIVHLFHQFLQEAMAIFSMAKIEGFLDMFTSTWDDVVEWCRCLQLQRNHREPEVRGSASQCLELHPHCFKAILWGWHVALQEQDTSSFKVWFLCMWINHGLIWAYLRYHQPIKSKCIWFAMVCKNIHISN